MLFTFDFNNQFTIEFAKQFYAKNARVTIQEGLTVTYEGVLLPSTDKTVLVGADEIYIDMIKKVKFI